MTLADWATALYTAAAQSYRQALKMPDRVWCSLDVWAALGALTDVARVVFPSGGNNDTAAGSSSWPTSPATSSDLPRIVVPTFPAGTCIVGPSSMMFEAYEEVIGLLSVIEPSILGVEPSRTADTSPIGRTFEPLGVREGNVAAGRVRRRGRPGVRTGGDTAAQTPATATPTPRTARPRQRRREVVVVPGTWPKLADVRSWLRMQPDPAEDQLIGASRVAAIDYGD